MLRALQRAAIYAVFITTSSTPALVLAVDPNPLESAYWRFEEGTAFGQVTPRNADVVQDSINDNEMRAFMNETIDASPTYVSDVPPAPLKNGLENTLALDFIPNQDIFSQEQPINNGFITSGGGFTAEAAFNVANTGSFYGIFGKEGQPGLGRGLGFIENLPTFAIKARRNTGNTADFRDGKLQVEQWDAAGNLVDVVSDNVLLANQWYYVAIVNDGATLSMYLSDGTGYQLQGTPVPVSGALYQGADPNNPDWDRPWTIGRAEFGGGPADFFNGQIDEVRLTNAALSPSQFLFAPPGDTLEGDYNEDGTVDAADYVVWRRDNIDGQAGYDLWRANFGMMAGGGGGVGGSAVPEPAALLLSLLTILGCSLVRNR